MEIRYEVDGDVRVVEVQPVQAQSDGNLYQIAVDGRTYTLQVVRRDGARFDLDVDGRRLRAYVAAGGPRIYVSLAGSMYALDKPSPRSVRPTAGRAPGAAFVDATMPGKVLDVLVQPGDHVAQGDTLLLLEAMKMELRLAAPRAGRVAAVHCAAGEVVSRGQRLVDMDSDEPSGS